MFQLLNLYKEVLGFCQLIMALTAAKKKMYLRVSYVFMTILLAVVGINDIIVHYPPNTSHTCPLKVCNETDEPLININTTECSYMKQFMLGNGKRLTVCKYQGLLRIDIRQFINSKSTIQGIWLRHTEWTSLLNQLPDIMTALIRGRDL